MYTLFVLTLSFSAIVCHAFDVKDIGDKISHLTSELILTDLDGSESKDVLDVCSKKCSKDIEELKKNMTELYMAFLSLHVQLNHMNQHMAFHEKALKHIAVWGHPKTTHQNNDHNFRSDNQDIDSRNESVSNSEQTDGSVPDLSVKESHPKHHHRHEEHQHTHQHNHNHKHHNSDNENKKKKNDESSEESSEEDTKPTEPTLPSNPDTKVEQNVTLNDSQITDPKESHPKKGHHSHHSIQEQKYFQTIEPEFKEWFNNMLNDIHHNERTVGTKSPKNWNFATNNQKVIDEMENALNSEELIFATCQVKPNRHITLLNQQDIEGTINIWQLKENRGPLHMHMKLKGFKVADHQIHHNQNKDHTNSRNRRDSNLMPVEVEPNESTHSSGSPHSHGFHVHESGNLSRGCQSVGGHYNPLNLTHGGPYDVIRHVGDLGNIRCDQNGEIDSEYTYSQVSLSGEYSIINKSLVIHKNTDDYGRDPNSSSSLTSGTSGVRIACCVIEEVNQLPKEVDSQSSIGAVGGPTVTSKRRRHASERERHQKHRNEYKDSNIRQLLKSFEIYENDMKHKTQTKTQIQ